MFFIIHSLFIVQQDSSRNKIHFLKFAIDNDKNGAKMILKVKDSQSKNTFNIRYDKKCGSYVIRLLYDKI